MPDLGIVSPDTVLPPASATGLPAAPPAAPTAPQPMPKLKPLTFSPSMPLAEAVAQPGAVDALVDQRIKAEGRSPEGVTNNPGNIKFAGLPGQIDSGIPAADGGTFASYASRDAGRAAIKSLITNAAAGRSPEYGPNPTVESFAKAYMGDGPRATLRQAAFGSFSPEAQQLVSQWTQRIDAASANYRAALQKADNLDDFGKAAVAKWMDESNRPPQNMHQAWQQWGGIAGALALFVPLFARGSTTAALSAAGTMMKAANQADVQSYDRNYQMWKDHLDEGLKAIQLLHGEAQDVINNAKLSYDEQLAQLDTLTKAYGLAQSLDHAKVAQIEQQLDLQQKVRGIIEANNVDAAVRQKDADWLRDHPQPDGQVPADVHAQHMGEVRREVGGTALHMGAQQEIQIIDKSGNVVRHGMAYNDPTTGAMRWLGTGEVVQDTVPPGGSIDKGSASTATAPHQQFTDGDVQYWANVLRNGGHLPSGLARTSQGSALVQRIMKEIPGLGGKDPGDFIANVATVKADDRSLSNMTKMADAATSFERTALQNFDLALRLSKDAVPTDWGPWINGWVMTGETQAGNPNVPPYVTAMLTGANEYAKIMSGSTGAQGSTVDGRREAAELFSPYLNRNQIDRVVAVAKADMANRKASLYGQIDDIKQRLRHAGSHEPTAQQEAPAGVPQDLPNAAGYPNGYVARDSSGRVVAKIINGQWAAP